MKKLIQTIKQKKISFFGIIMAFFMLCHAVWIIFLLCNLSAWDSSDEDLNPYVVVFWLMLAPIVVEILFGLIAYAVYEKARKRNTVYLCPLLFTAVPTLYILQHFGTVNIIDIVFIISLVGYYTLAIFIATKLAAPSERDRAERL
jgi:hypothetical protein